MTKKDIINILNEYTDIVRGPPGTRKIRKNEKKRKKLIKYVNMNNNSII